ncbi:MAG: IPT/TIG domain-containing protein, partial [Planctomycetes bacterium]|nr:IPT/TIG domain-containing protein [Planctomycetota bacterium]
MRRALLTLGVVLGFSGWLEAQVVVGPGHVFHYLRGYAPPPLDWNLLEFDPAAAGWDSGSLGIGYGDDDDVTILDDMPGNYLSVYLRTELEVPGVLEGFAWVLRARYDDGFVAYIDGQEVARAGLAGTPPAFDEGAQDHEITSPAGFDDSFPLLAATGILSEGAHVLAVQVHNSTLDSSDLSFYAELVAAPFIVSGIEPDRGPIEGGNTVSIHGQGFDDADPPLVTFGGTASGSVAVESVALLSVVVPPASGPGPVDVEIEDSRGGVILPGGYYYIVPGRSGLLFEQGDSATAAAGGDLAGEGTIEVWIRPEQGGFFTRWAVFAVEAAGGGDLFTLEYRSTQLRARYFPGGEEDRLTAGADLPVQNWHHIAFTYSPAGRRVYANGQLLASDDHFMQLP